MVRKFAYDIECYQNFFLLCAIDIESNKRLSFEISSEKCEVEELLKFMQFCRSTNPIGIGFNNKSYDYPILHNAYELALSFTTAEDFTRQCRELSNKIFSTKFNERWSNWVSNDAVVFPQLDLYLMNHYDNVNRRTSLKAIEVYLRMQRVETIPFKGEVLPQSMFATTREYCFHDVRATKEFFLDPINIEAFELRESLQEQIGGDVLNLNDGKIGQKVILSAIIELTKESCKEEGRKYENPFYIRHPDGTSSKKQTHRPYIDLGDVILPFVEFKHPPFQSLLHWIKNRRITSTKGSLKDLPINTLNEMFNYIDIEQIISRRIAKLAIRHKDMSYVFGTGGIHASLHNSTVTPTNTHRIIDIDVTSFYPSIAIQHRLFPEHLGEVFCDAYKLLFDRRFQYESGTSMNKAYKLALNTAYGNSNSEYTVLYDPKFTMAITINGQLMLAMLIEELVDLEGLTIIQANTDGLTANCPLDKEEELYAIVKAWEEKTKMNMEYAFYDSMNVRDVNNYIGVYEGAEQVKTKGDYAYGKIPPHKSQNHAVIKNAVYNFVINGIPVEDTIKGCTNPHDFCLVLKGGKSIDVITSSSPWKPYNGQRPKPNLKVKNRQQYDEELDRYHEEQLSYVDDCLADFELHGDLYRYYVALDGEHLYSCHNPTKNAISPARRVISALKDEVTKCVNNMEDFDFGNLKYEWYIEQAKVGVRELGLEIE